MGVGPSLWQRMRKWLRLEPRGRIPRPMPILLEDLYAPPTKHAYHAIRDWEERLVLALPHRSAEQDDTPRAVRTLATQIRRYLLLVQRLRHAIRNCGADTPTLRALWWEHEVSWQGTLLMGIERLRAATEPLIKELIENNGERDVSTVLDAMNALQISLEVRTTAVKSALQMVQEIQPNLPH